MTWQAHLTVALGPDDGLIVIDTAIPRGVHWPYRVVIDPGLPNAELVYLTGEGADQRAYSAERGVLGGERSSHAIGATVRWASPIATDSTGTTEAHPDLATHVSLGLASQGVLDTGLASKAAAAHNHDASYAATAHAHVHAHPESEVSGLVADLAAKAATVHAHVHAHPESEITGLAADLAAKAAAAHVHAEAEVTGLASDLGAKAAAVHNHDTAYAPVHSHPYAATSHAHVDADLPAAIARDTEVAQAITDHLAAAQHGSTSGVPIGVIVMWGGLISAIPSGWALCNGLNGTPDLRDRFVKGAANGANPGTTGGAATHSHGAHVVTQPGSATTGLSLSAHAGAAVADHTVTQPAGHANHVVTQPTAAAEAAHTHAAASTPATPKLVTGNTSTGVGVLTGAGTSHTHAISGAAVDAHSAHTGTAVSSHSVTQPAAHTVTDPGHAHSGAAVSAHDTVNSEPAYYALAFIQKIA
jgi:hypothetical protein